MKTLRDIYENNISEDIVRVDDTLESEMSRIAKKLDMKNREFFLVVLNDNEQIVGIITNKELVSMLKEVKRCSSLKVNFERYAKKHIALTEDQDSISALEALKDKENRGWGCWFGGWFA